MVSIGGQTRPTVGDPIVQSQSGGTQVMAGVGGASGSVRINNFEWTGADKSGITGLLSGVSCKGFIPFLVSGQVAWLAYWTSA